jgi:ABC-type sugar transport system permease subunit
MNVQLENQRLPQRSIAHKRKFLWEIIAPYLYLIPAVVLVVGLFIYSAFFTLSVSLTEWDGINTPIFIGLKNYLEVFTDSIFMGSMINTIVWVVASLFLPVGIGLVMAVGIQNIRWSTVYKNVFYLPYAISLTTAGVIWAFLLSSQGLSNFFEHIGWDFLALDWLRRTPLNTISMIGAYTWQSMGTNMVLFLVGLNAIPKDPLEAGMIDGASGWRLFRRITFPLLKPITGVVVLMALVNSFKVFDSIWVMTQGGPYRSSETLAVSMYRESFVLSHYGKGSAFAVILSVFVFILSWGYLRSSLKEERG